MRVLLVFFLAGASAINLRTESGRWSDVERSIFNNTISKEVWSHSVGLVQREVEMVKQAPPVVDKVAYTFLAMWCGVCGCDRCYMGQIALGLLKWFTFGGFLIWHFVDYFVAVYHAYTKAPAIHAVGYHATFLPATIENAMYVGIVFFVLDFLRCCSGCKTNSMQREEQEAYGCDPAMHHQVYAHMPAVFSRNLRQAGYISEKPTTVELIKIFNEIDANKDGNLDKAEFRTSMLNHGVSEETINEMFTAADTNGDGKLDKNEFVKIAMKEN